MHPICKAGPCDKNIMQKTNTSFCNFTFSGSHIKKVKKCNYLKSTSKIVSFQHVTKIKYLLLS